MIDNITALAAINKMDSFRTPKINSITKELCQWAEDRKLWLFAEYVASKENLADFPLRIDNIDTE